MNRILDNPEQFFDIVQRLNGHNCNLSFNKTVDKLDFNTVYREALSFIRAINNTLDELQDLCSNTMSSVDLSYRIKAKDSMLFKWNKNLQAKRPLKKVCNDIIGIRLITDLSNEDVANLNMDALSHYKVKVVDFHNNPKALDDGYRGIHIYFNENSKCFPVEIQIWNRADAIVNFYTHEVIYKAAESKDIGYARDLREWFNSIPNNYNASASFIDYIYNIVYSQIGGD